MGREPNGRRFDMSFPVADSASQLGQLPWCEDIQKEMDKWIRPVLEASAQDHGKGCVSAQYGGCVTSVPGAPHQLWHADGPYEGLVTAFAPLIDVTSENGQTEIRLGSHKTLVPSILGIPIMSGDPRVGTVAPTLQAGEMLLFDYRCRHRGRRNVSAQPRSVAYMVYAMRRGAKDWHNFHNAMESLLPLGPEPVATAVGKPCADTDKLLFT